MTEFAADLFPAFAHEDWRSHRAPVEMAVRRVMEGGQYILHAEVAAFETEWAAYLKSGHAVGLASGTDAIELMLRALGIGNGDKVVIPSLAPSAVAAGVARTGAGLLLADCDEQALTLSPAALHSVLSSPAGYGVKAALVVQLFGQVADWAGLWTVAEAHGIHLLEDASQAHGAEWRGRKAGTLGVLSAFSFYPTKNLAAMGDAGALVTHNEGLADKVRLLRQYGWVKRHVSDMQGVNSRMDEIQAAVLRIKLATLDERLRMRRKFAARYTSRLAAIGEVARPPLESSETSHAWHQYVVRSSRRDQLHAYLRGKGIPAVLPCIAAIHQQPAYAVAACRSPSLTESEKAAAETLSLPMHPYLSLQAVDLVCDLIAAF